jgi:asparagine synthetase B (glutamine-hydrolysing)
MLRHAGVPIEENTRVLPELFVYRYVMPPNTLYRKIKQLIAGSCVKIQITNENCELLEERRYIPPSPTYPTSSNDEEISSQLLNLLTNTLKPLHPVKSRIAPLLSGGLDSSILCVECKNEFKTNDSYSTAYPFEYSKANTEMDYALSASSVLGTNHSFYEVTTRDYLYGFLESIQAAEEPLHHLQSVMFYLLFRELPKDKNVILCGQGADGVFGLGLHNFLFRSGQPSYRLLSKFPIITLLDLVSTITGKGKALTGNLKRLDKQYTHIADPNNIVWTLGAYGNTEWVSRFFQVSDEEIIGGRLSSIQVFKDRSLYDIISIVDFLGDVSVTTAIWSKLAESHGRIVYYPFNDVDILNYAYTIPWKTKLANPKNILREVARRLSIPEFIITRPKSGFGIRPLRWAKRGGIFEPLVSLAVKVFDLQQIQRMQSVNDRDAMTFWNILNYSIWKRLFVEDEPVTELKTELEEALSKTPYG